MQQQQQDNGVSLRETLDWVYLLAVGHTVCTTVFTRTRFGREALGLPGLIAMIFWFLAMGFSGAPGDFVPVTCLWFAALAYQRWRTMTLGLKGWREHSRYPGFPWLIYKILPGVKNEMWARANESVLCLWAGIVVMAVYSEPLGIWIASGFCSHLMVRSVEYQANVQAVQALTDAELRNRHVAGLYRGERNDF